MDEKFKRLIESVINRKYDEWGEWVVEELKALQEAAALTCQGVHERQMKITTLTRQLAEEKKQYNGLKKEYDKVHTDLMSELSTCRKELAEAREVTARYGKEMDSRAQIIKNLKKEVEALRGGYERILRYDAKEQPLPITADKVIVGIYAICHESLDPTPPAGGEE